MHIGMDVELQELNSAVFGDLQSPEKDYILNDVIVNLIRSAINKDDNTVSNIVSYQDIREYYHILEPFLRTTQLEHIHTTGDLYTEGVLPVSVSTATFTSGVLYADVKYKVTIAGTTDLTAFGYKIAPVVGETFTCVMADLTGTPMNIDTDSIYRILDPGAMSFISSGADSNDPGTYFVATGSSGVTGTPAGTLERIAHAPTWAGGTELIPIYDMGYNNMIKVDAVITT